jgi:uncharacterized repeat protein (TIGR01451 family)
MSKFISTVLVSVLAVSIGLTPSVTVATGGADLSIIATGSSSVVRGSDVQYSLSVTNAGPDSAVNSVVSDVLPSGISFDAAASDASCSVQGSSVVCALGTMTSGQTKAVTLSLNIPFGGTCTGDAQLQNSFTVSSDTSDSNTANNSSSVTTVVHCPSAGVTGCIDVLLDTYDTLGNVMSPVTQFSFLLDGAVSAVNDGSGHAQFSGVSVGTHTITQDTPSAWTLLSVTPSNGTVNVTNSAQCAVVFFRDKQVSVPSDGGNSGWNNNQNVTVNTTVNPNINTTVNPVFNLWLESQLLGQQGTNAVTPTPPGLRITKTDDRDTAAPGEILTYRISITNGFSYAVPDLTVFDYLPHDIIFNNASDEGYLTGNSVKWSTINLASGETKNLTVTVTIPTYMKDGTVIDNVAQIFNGPSAEDTTVVQTGSNAGCPLSVTADPQTVQPGSKITYTITPRNDHDQALIETITGRFDIRSRFASASDGARGRGSQVQWDSLTISGHSSRPITTIANVTQYAKDGDSIKFVASVGSCEVSASTLVYSNPVPVGTVLTIIKRADRLEAQPGDMVTYTITVTNTSSKVLNDVKVLDTYNPLQMTVLSASEGGVLANGSISWALGQLAASQTKVLSYQGRIHSLLKQGDSVSDTAIASAQNVPPVSSSATVYILRVPPQTGVDLSDMLNAAGLILMITGMLAGAAFMKRYV